MLMFDFLLKRFNQINSQIFLVKYKVKSGPENSDFRSKINFYDVYMHIFTIFMINLNKKAKIC